MTKKLQERIPRIAAADSSRFSTIYRCRRPVVLTAAMESWPDTLFDIDRLEAMFGGQTALIYKLPKRKRIRRMSSINNNFYIWSDAKLDLKAVKRSKFGDFLSSLKSGHANYCMANSTKNTKLRDLLADEAGTLDPALTDGPIRGSAAEFFFGSEGASPGLHHDGSIESFLCQLIGVKQVNVFSPIDIPYLYPAGSWLDQNGHFSLVSDSFRGGGREFPRFRLATKYTCQLKVGEVLYVPPHWYHDPSPTGPSLSMTFRKVPPSDMWGVAQDDQLLKHAIAGLFESMKKCSPMAREAYCARLIHDLVNAGRMFQRRHASRRRARS